MTRLTSAVLGLALVLTAAPPAQSQMPGQGKQAPQSPRVRAETRPDGSVQFVLDPTGIVPDLKKLEDERRQQFAALPAEVKERIETAKKSVGLVRGKSGLGSGFMVGPNLFATNSHVISGEAIADLTVQFVTANDPNPKRLPVALLYEDRTQDLALLRVETDRPALKLASADEVRGGLKLAVIGNPAEFNAAAVINSVSVGTYVETVQRKDRGRGYYRIDAYAEKGNSGGPVVSQATGEVVGVLTFGVSALVGKDNYCVPLPAIRGAITTVGPAAGWTKRAATQSAIHTAALVHATLADFDEEAKTAMALLTEMWRRGVPALLIDGKRFNGWELVADVGKRMEADTQRTKKLVAGVRGNPHLPAKARRALEGLQVDAEHLAQLVKQRTNYTRTTLVAEQFAKESAALAKQLDELNGK